jgi:hypothetical protein
MPVVEAAKRQRCIDTEGLARGLTELRTGKHGAVIDELTRPWSKTALTAWLMRHEAPIFVGGRYA